VSLLLPQLLVVLSSLRLVKFFLKELLAELVEVVAADAAPVLPVHVESVDVTLAAHSSPE
jgi:hypothetical protein